MEIRNITTFLKVAATQNFSKAAEQLGYSQSAVTIQMQQLEKELGTKLFERIGKTVSLTSQGERFITYANEIVRVTNEAMAFATDRTIPEGTLRIGSVDSLATAILPNLLLQFHHICPKVEIVIKTDTSDGLIEMIKSNEIDLFLTLDHKIYGTEWIRAMQREEDIVFVTSSKNILASEKKQDLMTIIKEPFLLTEKGESYRYELERMLSENDIDIKPILEIGNTETIIHLLEEGMGFSFLPFFSVRESIEQGNLFQIETNAPTIRMWSQLLYHKNKWVTPQMKIFIAITQKFFQ
ncbi:HTH-type transcriptional regulator GltR [Clostridiales bacterium CHKCI001]|nr:HTH-type transcriptional regulator GltR [Clostridiales bacterium CHKCI001]